MFWKSLARYQGMSGVGPGQPSLANIIMARLDQSRPALPCCLTTARDHFLKLAGNNLHREAGRQAGTAPSLSLSPI